MAAPVFVDFDNLSPGAVVNNQYSGVHFSLLGSPPIGGPRTYSLDDANGDMADIYGSTGNAITSGDVTDRFLGNPLFDFEVRFGAPIDYFSIMAIDAEEPVCARAYLDAALVQTVLQGVLIGNYGGTPAGGYFRGPVYNLELGGIGGSLLFNRVIIDLIDGDHPAAGPELYDNLIYHPVPEPTSLILLGLAVVGIRLTGRQKVGEQVAVSKANIVL